MTRVCFTLQVRPERIDDYRTAHANVWPELRAALQEAGWHNYSLFMRADGTVIGYLETDDFAAAQARMAVQEINERWQRGVHDMFADLPAGVNPDAAMRPLPEIFHLD